MPSILFDTLAGLWPGAEQRLQLQAWTYQVASYAMLHLMDDPAWLALVFC